VAKKKSFLKRLAWSLAWLILVCVAASVLMVALLRWINPPYTSFMAQTQMAAWSAAAPSAYVQQRRDWILGHMQALGGAQMLDEIAVYPSRRR
jgi:hypothetical protein